MQFSSLFEVVAGLFLCVGGVDLGRIAPLPAFLYSSIPLRPVFIVPTAVDMEAVGGTAVSGIPTRKQGCPNEMDSEGVHMHTQTH